MMMPLKPLKPRDSHPSGTMPSRREPVLSISEGALRMTHMQVYLARDCDLHLLCICMIPSDVNSSHIDGMLA